MIFKGKYRVTSGFELPDRPDHHGLDLVGDEDRTVYSPVGGVVRSSTMVTNRNDLTWEWGNYVRVDDSAGNRLFFCHLDSRAVSVGQKVQAGDKIGIMGNTGKSYGAHTHFEMRKADGRTYLNPATYLGIPNKKGSYSAQKPIWEKIGGKWKYKSENGGYAASKWVEEDNRWYYIGADGFAVTGFQTIGGKPYYFYDNPLPGKKECEMLKTNDKGAIV